MDENKIIDLTKRFSKMSDGHNPAEVLAASFNMIRSVCAYEPRLSEPTAKFLEQFAEQLRIQADGFKDEGIIVEH